MAGLEGAVKKAEAVLLDYRTAKAELTAERRRLRQARERLTAAREAQAAFQTVAKTIQQTAHRQIAGVVTKCIKAVYGKDSYTFDIVFEKKRGKTEARLRFTNAAGYELDKDEGVGGGMRDLTAFALQLVTLVLSRPKCRMLFVGDETFKHLSARGGLRKRVRKLIQVLSDKLDVQFIFVTHSRALEMGKVVEIK